MADDHADEGDGARELTLREMDQISGGDTFPYGMLVTNYFVYIRAVTVDTICSGADAKTCAQARKTGATNYY